MSTVLLVIYLLGFLCISVAHGYDPPSAEARQEGEVRKWSHVEHVGDRDSCVAFMATHANLQLRRGVLDAALLPGSGSGSGYGSGSGSGSGSGYGYGSGEDVVKAAA